jgi:hypothetical protein
MTTTATIDAGGALTHFYMTPSLPSSFSFLLRIEL